MKRFVEVKNLKEFAKSSFLAAGVPEPDADFAAEACIEADLQGLTTHGISRLKAYIDALSSGKIKAHPNIAIHVTGHSTAIVDGNNGLGSVSALRAVDTAANLARSSGLGAVTVRNGNHIGALCVYTEIVAKRGMIALCCCNAQPAIAPWGGRQAYFGTNPIALAAPTGGPFPVSIDLATSIVARGNIILAAKRGQTIPESWAIDSAGQPTINAAEALAGAVLPMAGPKGYALALLVEILSGVLSGANIGDKVGSLYGSSLEPPGTGFFILVINPECFVGSAKFSRRMDTLVEEIHNNPLAAGSKKIYIPGERRYNEKLKRVKDSVPVSDDIWIEMQTLANRYELPLPAYVI